MGICKKKESQHTEPEINLTALIDVVFVLLIAFIIIAPILEIEHIQLAQGGKNKEAFENTKSVSFDIFIQKDNALFVDKTPLLLQDLLTIAQEKYLLGTVPKLFCDKSSQFGTYQNVKNILEEAGFQEMELVLLP